MSYDEKTLLEDLRRDEGVRLKPYRDQVGKLTIGIGRNLDDVGITTEEADYLLRNDVYRVERELDAELPWWRTLDPVRQRVILNMAFNLGVDGLLPGGARPGFPRTLELVRAGRYLEASQAMLASKWAKQVGIGDSEHPGRALRLATMMRDGEHAGA